jgi:NAD(P)H-dependent flavin oxidoreductase YrpB (nitropropane dioxygenase family)
VWLTCEEAETDPVVKQKFLAATARDTVRSRSITGKPARMLRSAWTSEWAGEKAPDTLPVPLQSALIAEAQQRIIHAGTHPGATELAQYFVGQVVGRLGKERSCRQVLLDMVTEYAEVVERFAAQVED